MKVAISSKNFSGYTGSFRIIDELSKRFIERGNSVDIVGNTINKEPIRHYGARPVVIKKWLFGTKLSRTEYMKRHQLYARSSGHDLYIGNGDEAFQHILLLHNCVNLHYEIVNNAPYAGDADVSNVSQIHGHILKNKLFGRIVANSNLMREDISKRYNIDKALIEVIYPAYDKNMFTPQERMDAKSKFCAKYSIQNDKILVGQITSGDFTKRGVKKFISICNKLQPELSQQIHIVVVGKGSLDEIGKIPKNFTYIQHCSEPASVMRSLDIMLYPALLEEFGLVVAETLACGTPVIASRMVGATELFTGLHSEVLTDRPDEDAMYAALSRFLSEESYKTALQLEAAKQVECLAWDNYFESFLRVVHAVI